MAAYRSVLVAAELSSETRRLLTRAVEVAPRAEIHLVHVEEHPVTGYGDSTGHNHSVNEMQIRQSVYPKLKSLAEPFELPTDHLHILFGDPGPEVHQLADNLGTDLIITGSHGKHGWRLLLGSTSSDIQHGAKMDVLSVYTGGP